jgi:RNA polymerase sigma factor (sigma-70 family)
MEMADEMLNLAQHGDQRAFTALIEPSLDKAFRLAYGVLQDRSAAQDATQEAALTAWRKIGNVRAGTPVEPWFLAIVANRCRKVMRRARAAPRPTLASSTAIADRINDRVDIERALSSLSGQQRLLVVLHYYRDLPVEETAKIAGVPLGTAKSRLHRALALMRANLETAEALDG